MNMAESPSFGTPAAPTAGSSVGTPVGISAVHLRAGRGACLFLPRCVLSTTEVSCLPGSDMKYFTYLLYQSVFLHLK